VSVLKTAPNQKTIVVVSKTDLLKEKCDSILVSLSVTGKKHGFVYNHFTMTQYECGTPLPASCCMQSS
jgi:hypothetical protein